MRGHPDRRVSDDRDRYLVPFGDAIDLILDRTGIRIDQYLGLQGRRPLL
jgi:hypothetical protein